MGEHVHTYLIDPPNGPTASGKCEDCGQVRKDFRNSLFKDYAGWRRDGESIWNNPMVAPNMKNHPYWQGYGRDSG